MRDNFKITGKRVYGKTTSKKSNIYQIVSDSIVVILLIFVEPDLRQADGIFSEHINAAAPFVRRSFS